MVQNAIILAAGFGSRLAPRSASKPLAQIHGVSLIEIAVRQAMAAGVKHIRVVTGHAADYVEAELAILSDKTNCDIMPVRLNDWSKPNGWSAIAGAKGLSEPFLLMMADHIFSDSILPRLAQQSLDGDDAILATDRIDNPLVDPDDATWVRLNQGNRIGRIGKNIAKYDVVDCGAFLANQNLPRAIKKSIEAGKAGSLSDGMQALADENRARIVDVNNAWWIDVDDPRAHDLAIAQISDHLSLFAGSAPISVRGARAA